MIQSYDLYLPTHLVFGKGRIAELGNLIKGYGKKVLLAYGGGIRQADRALRRSEEDPRGLWLRRRGTRRYRPEPQD